MTVYRCWADPVVRSPTIYEVIGMYVIGFGRFHPNFRLAMASFDKFWRTYTGPVRPIFVGRPGSLAIRDAPLKLNSTIDTVQPFKRPVAENALNYHLQCYDSTGRWPTEVEGDEPYLQELVNRMMLGRNPACGAVPAIPIYAGGPVIPAAVMPTAVQGLEERQPPPYGVA